jgi:aminoglycoside 3-N-acetyltransferase
MKGWMPLNQAKIIQHMKRPHTVDSLAEDFRRLGMEEGMTVIVHSSLSSLGFVCGGPVAVVQALMKVITEEGTLVMPAFSADYSDPSRWENPPVPESWWPVIRQAMPAYDPQYTPTLQMGKIVEVFRTMPGVMRSRHPSSSFVAWGREAKAVVEDHSLDFPLGEQSPLARIYERDGRVLLLGVGYGNNTSFHLAEYRLGTRSPHVEGAPMMVEGKRRWVTYQDIPLMTERFEALGSDFEGTGAVRVSRIGPGEARLFSQRAAVDFALEWFRRRERADEKTGA